VLKGRTHNVKTSRILGAGGVTQGILIVIRDVTEELEAKTALQLANEKLSLLAMVARHDMMNKLVVQRGYLELMEREGTGNVLSEDRRQKMLTNVRDMEDIMGFARDYQRLGLTSPEWHNLRSTLQEAERSVHPQGIAVRTEVDGIEMYADGMLEKVFTNLMDNSLRHGEKVTTIRVHTLENPDHSLSILYEDDGVGVPVAEKDLIFQLGHGRNTGLGMYLSRQILRMTGASLREIGRPGEGCIFEILVPPGKWRSAS
jgi:signal transduction histidine kinase